MSREIVVSDAPVSTIIRARTRPPGPTTNASTTMRSPSNSNGLAILIGDHVAREASHLDRAAHEVLDSVEAMSRCGCSRARLDEAGTGADDKCGFEWGAVAALYVR